MTQDLQIIPSNSGPVIFDVYGKAEDSVLALLQRVYVLLLGGRDSLDPSTPSDGLLDRIGSTNIPSTTALQSILTTACANAKAALDEEDADRIDSLTAEATSEAGDSVSIQVSLILNDGTTINGTLK